MSVINYDWEIRFTSGGKEVVTAPEPVLTETEIIFSPLEGEVKKYFKVDVRSFVPTGFHPFLV